ncbi:MAG TPA: CoA transferase [Acidimicrobiales bacterium]|nr:CoA transferase [Acidimicrobiales bacterium]
MAEPRPLAGIRVLDLSEVVAGPIVGRMLADLGAEVVKVERPSGDTTRIVAPERGGQSVYFTQLNAGKRNVSLDLRDPLAAALVARLAERVDVLIENFRPGVLDKRGLGARALRERNARLIYCSISGWGQSGPWAQRRAYAPLIHAETGLLELSARLRRRAPEQEVHVHADLNTGFFALSAILAALYQRSVTGQGQHLDVAMAEVAAYADDWAAVDCAGGGEDRLFDIWNHPVVQLGDGSYATLVGNRSRMLERFIETMGGDTTEIRDDPRLLDFASREANRALVDEILQRHAATVPDFAALEARFEAAGIMTASLRTTCDLSTTPWSVDRDAFHEVEPGVRVPTAPWRSDGATIGVRGTASRRGSDTEAVLRELLDLDDDEIELLRAAHICE